MTVDSPVDLGYARQCLDENGIDGPDRPYNPDALAALRVADALYAEVLQRRRVEDAQGAAGEAYRGSPVEEWLKNCRNSHTPGSGEWTGLDEALEDYRFRADTGTALTTTGTGGTADPDDGDVPAAATPTGGLTRNGLIALLRQHRDNDVYVQITDTAPDQLGRARVHGVTYNPLADQLVVLAHENYR